MAYRCLYLLIAYLISINKFSQAGEEGSENSLKSAFQDVKDFVKDFDVESLKSTSKEGLQANIEKVEQFLSKIKEKSKDIKEKSPLLGSVVDKVNGWLGSVQTLKTEVANESTDKIEGKSKEWDNLLTEMKGNGLGKLVTFIKGVTSAAITVSPMILTVFLLACALQLLYVV